MQKNYKKIQSPLNLKCKILQLCLEGIFTIYTIQFCASIPMCVLQYVVCTTLQSAIVQDWEVIVLIIIHDSHLDSPGRALFWFDSNIRSVNVNACTSIFFFSVHYCIPGDKRFGLVGDPSFNWILVFVLSNKISTENNKTTHII